MSGLAVWAKADTRPTVRRVATRNAGRARIVAASEASRDAVVANSELELRTNDCS